MKTAEDALIRMFHVHKRFNVKPALIDITIDLFKNEFIFLTGPSGAGKSTLLKLLYLGESISEGQILIDGMNLSRITASRAPILRRKLGIVFQDYKLIPSKTVYENIALVLEARGLSRRFIQKKVNSVLRTVGMEDRKKSFPLSLSGGEQQRVAVARAVAGDPKIILADEPTGSLDAESADTIFTLFKTFHRRGAMVILATHDTALLREKHTRIIHLKKGRIDAIS
jgi:cell division transport system ATP-binding protein